MAGRPTKYDPEMCEQARKLCLLGATDKDLANFFGVDEATVNRWKLEHSEFCASIKSGKEIADAEVVQSLYDKALSGDTTACIFWLKNRRKSDWRDKQDHEHDVNLKGEIVSRIELVPMTNDDDR